MKHIESFLENKQLTGVLTKKKKVIDIVQTITGITLGTQHVSFSGDTIVIKATPKDKTQILINREKILGECRQTKLLSFYKQIQ
jgi:capsular polysaccharide biosynthesis protein